MLGSLGGGVPAAEIRAEAWALGGRHQGDVLLGARTELRQQGISPRRASLLRAVIRSRPEAAR
ncbi:MAG: hypothetical protein GC145_00945 [Caulobacter sp.]|nr:hypothetical protein [Caulobacter sp.]